MDQEQQPWWRKQVLWPVVLAAAVAFLIIVICGYLFGWGWTGVPKKTLWDWLRLLIVPVVLAIGGYLLNSSQTRATQDAAERRAQDEAMQAYLDDMTELMMKYHLRAPPPEEDLADVHVVAQARTVTVLRGMDAMHVVTACTSSA
jgi:hypothetical protein